MKFHNRLTRTYLSWLIILTFLISGCAPATQDTERSTVTIAPSATLPVVTNTPEISPIVEITPTPTVEATSEITLLDECIPIEEKMPDNLTLSGVWVRNKATPYLETVDGLTAYEVPLRGGGLFSTNKGDMAISPDGKHLAYIDIYVDPIRNGAENRILRIIKSSGHVLPTDFWIENWQWIIGWIDDRRIALFTGNREIIILNPFSGEWERPEQPQWLQTTNFFDYSGPFYNPKLESILVRLESPNFELRNFQTGKTLYHGTGFLDRWNHDWSSDGLTVAIATGNSTISVVTGDQQALNLDLTGIGIESINHLNLSPDGHKLVFTSYWSGELFLFDFEQLEIRKLCSEEFDYWESAVWSPDGHFVIQEAYKSYFDQFDIMIDTQQMLAYKLTSGQYQHRLVWLTSP